MKQIHKYFGNAIYIVAKVTVLLGAFISWNPEYDSWEDIALYVLYIFTLTWRVLFEISYF
jgi:hypothetical protein